jgi:hypothetical protein
MSWHVAATEATSGLQGLLREQAALWWRLPGQQQHDTAASAPPLPLQKLCSAVRAGLASTPGRATHINEGHLAREIRGEFSLLGWDMGRPSGAAAPKPAAGQPPSAAAAPPSAEAIALSIGRMIVHVGGIVETRRELLEGLAAQQALRDQLAVPALQVLHATPHKYWSRPLRLKAKRTLVLTVCCCPSPPPLTRNGCRRCGSWQ